MPSPSTESRLPNRRCVRIVVYLDRKSNRRMNGLLQSVVMPVGEIRRGLNGLAVERYHSRRPNPDARNVFSRILKKQIVDRLEDLSRHHRRTLVCLRWKFCLMQNLPLTVDDTSLDRCSPKVNADHSGRIFDGRIH